MRDGLVLGVDVGTGSAKALLLDPARGPVGFGSAPYEVDHPRDGWADQDPSHWWDGVVAAVRQAVRSVAPEAVRAIAVSGQGAALVLLDSSGAPVRPALIHLDQRASVEASALAAGPVGASVARASGNVVGAWNVAAKLAWVRRHEPEAFARTHCVTSAAGYVLSRLSGRLVQSESDAGISDLFDLQGRSWSANVLAALDVPAALLPDVASAMVPVGVLREAAALGLRSNVQVVAGGEDTSSAALAAGVLRTGEGYLSLGTAGVVGVAVNRGLTLEPRLLTFPHVCPDLDLLSGSMTSAGSALAWLADLTGASPGTLLEEAGSVPAGARGVVFVPYLAGELHPINDPHARGTFGGLALDTSRAELARAVVEGSAGAVAHNLAVAASAGARPVRLFATGRPTSSALWMRSVADASRLPVEVVAPDGAPLGDALLAAAESMDELAELVAAHRTVHATYEPAPGQFAAAADRRARVAALYEASRS